MNKVEKEIYRHINNFNERVKEDIEKTAQEIVKTLEANSSNYGELQRNINLAEMQTSWIFKNEVGYLEIIKRTKEIINESIENISIRK